MTLKAFLSKEGLCLCKTTDTQRPLDGFRENEVLGTLVDLVEDAQAFKEWSDESSDEATTKPIPTIILEKLREDSNPDLVIPVGL